MMKINLAIAFLLFVSYSFSQEKLAVKFEPNNFIYAGLYTPIQILGCADMDAIEVTSRDAKIEKKDGRKYTLRAEKPGVVYIEIYNKKSKSTQSIPVRVKVFPIPTVFLDREFIDLPLKKKFQISRSLRTHTYELGRSFFWDRKLTFDLTIIHSDKIYRFENQENKFSKEIKSLFNTLQKDDLVVFYNIQAKTRNDENFILKDLVYKID